MSKTKKIIYFLSFLLFFLMANPALTPSSAEENTASLAGIYQVKANDTIFTLASHWHVSIEALKELNQLTTDNIQVGQILIIPQPISRGSTVRQNRFLPTLDNPARLPTTQVKINQQEDNNIVNIIEKYLGKPYVYGCTDPEIGFDCSGFTQYVYALLGRSLPRTSYDQFTTGTDIAKDNLCTGDLVFFNTGSALSHVGIYLGENNFASATLSRGIAIDDLNSSYWSTRYAGAKRIN